MKVTDLVTTDGARAGLGTREYCCFRLSFDLRLLTH